MLGQYLSHKRQEEQRILEQTLSESLRATERALEEVDGFRRRIGR
jgi:hypothetical protein